MKDIPQIAKDLFGDNHLAQCGGGHKICLNCYNCHLKSPERICDPDTNLASVIDATILKAEAKRKDVEELCKTANLYKTASVCVNSYFIPLVKELLEQPVKICTVINFPLGASSPEAILNEAIAVLEAKAEENDMGQNLSALLSGDYKNNLPSTQEVVNICNKHNALLKVILETCYLTEEQIIISALLAKKAGADFIKTSTGFGSQGATIENIALMREVVGPKIGVKAAGGIRTKEQALAMIKAGANRIGASNVVAILQ
jgi:deoxyribose-phosphate aldolase